MFYLNKHLPSHLGGPYPREHGWIYLAYDIHKPKFTKIGHTTIGLWNRLGIVTENPDYVLFAAFRIATGNHFEIEAIEDYCRHKTYSWKKEHAGSGADSEHVGMCPLNALGVVVDVLSNSGIGIPTNEDLEYDFTNWVYFPEVNPYLRQLTPREQSEFVLFASPYYFFEELKYYQSPDLQDFLTEISKVDARGIYNLVGPDILLQKLSYDIALRRFREQGRVFRMPPRPAPRFGRI